MSKRFPTLTWLDWLAGREVSEPSDQGSARCGVHDAEVDCGVDRERTDN